MKPLEWKVIFFYKIFHNDITGDSLKRLVRMIVFSGSYTLLCSTFPPSLKNVKLKVSLGVCKYIHILYISYNKIHNYIKHKYMYMYIYIYTYPKVFKGFSSTKEWPLAVRKDCIWCPGVELCSVVYSASILIPIFPVWMGKFWSREKSYLTLYERNLSLVLTSSMLHHSL